MPICCKDRARKYTSSNQDFEVKEVGAAPPKAAESEAKTEANAADKPETAATTADKSKDHANAKKEETKTTKIPRGSYIIRMDQPYSRIADMLLDTQYYSTSDPRPYDDTGWTLGPLRNVKTLRITDVAVLKAPMTLSTYRRAIATPVSWLRPRSRANPPR